MRTSTKRVPATRGRPTQRDLVVASLLVRPVEGGQRNGLYGGQR